MIGESTAADRILGLLSDGNPHFSAELRDRLGLLEYRKPITILRRRGFDIASVWIEPQTMAVKEHPSGFDRPGYQLIGYRAQ